jgi:hypothetical protein
VVLLAADDNICDLFGKAKVGQDKLGILFEGWGANLSVLPPGLVGDIGYYFSSFDMVFRVHNVVLYTCC